MDKDKVMRDRLTNYCKDRQDSDKRNKDKRAKDNLKRLIKKKCGAIMIGALAKCETFLGEKWGHGKKEEDCTDEQLEFFEIWQQCRDEILNNGNMQIRAIEKELDLYKLEVKGYEFKNEIL